MQGGWNSSRHFQHKQDNQNIVAVTLSRRYSLLSTLHSRLLGFEHLQDLYDNDVDFASVFNACEETAFQGFYRHDRFLLKGG